MSPQIFLPAAPFLALRLFSPPQGYNSGENKVVLVPRIVQLRYFCFDFSPRNRLLPPLSAVFFCLRHNHSLPCGVFPPPQGHKPRPKEVDACLFHDQPRQQSRNHSTSPNSQPSSTASSRCSCVRSSSQQQPRSAAASRQRRCTVCRCSVEVDACISGSELR
jgi:hypothetical protein